MSETKVFELQPVFQTEIEPFGLIVEEIKFHSSGQHSRLVVVVDLPDGPGSVSSDQLTQATRAINTYLDENDPIKGAYTLEVTTAGAERKLTDRRLYRRAVGKDVELTTVDGQKLIMTLAEVNDSGIKGTVTGSEKELAWEEISRARTVVKW